MHASRALHTRAHTVRAPVRRVEQVARGGHELLARPQAALRQVAQQVHERRRQRGQAVLHGLRRVLLHLAQRVADERQRLDLRAHVRQGGLAKPIRTTCRLVATGNGPCATDSNLTSRRGFPVPWTALTHEQA